MIIISGIAIVRDLSLICIDPAVIYYFVAFLLCLIFIATSSIQFCCWCEQTMQVLIATVLVCSSIDAAMLCDAAINAGVSFDAAVVAAVTV